jgi:hypothetical protein
VLYSSICYYSIRCGLGYNDGVTSSVKEASSYEIVPTSYNQRARLQAAYSASGWLRRPSGIALRISAPLDKRQLAAALTVSARRHSALRTFFPRDLAPEHAACIHQERIEWPVMEIAACGYEFLSETGAGQFLAPFIPDEPPLLRAALSTVDRREHILGLAIDHMNFDGQSSGVLAYELASSWMNISNDVDIFELSQSSVRYDRFVHWQHDWVKRMGQEALDYWTSQWGAAGLYPEFPFPDPRDTPVDTRSRVWEHSIDTNSLERSGKRLAVGHFTDFMLLAAAVLLVVNDRFDLPCPSLLFPFANRMMPGSDRMVGYFSNRLLLRAKLGAATSFKVAAEEVRSSLADSLYYGPLPYYVITEHLFSEKADSRPPHKYLFLNVETVGQRYPVPGGFATEISPSPISDMGSNPGMFISIITDRSTHSMILRCLYNPRFYADRAVEQFMTEVLAKLHVD